MATSEQAGPEIKQPPAPPRFQFSLARLLAAPVWLALFFASIAWMQSGGAVLFIFFSCLAYTLCIPPPKNVSPPFRREYIVWALGWAVLCIVMAAVPPLHLGVPVWFLVTFGAFLVFITMGFMLPSMHWFCAGLGLLMLLILPMSGTGGGRKASRRAQCTNNLKQIGLALHNYHDRFGCFPPAYVADEEGRSMYSWRVLILRYVEQKPLYDAFCFDEPWDSPNNLPLSQTPLDAFQCPSDKQGNSKSAAWMTSYLAVVGPGTAWPGDKSTCFDDFTDGTANTILVVEVNNSGVHWAEPRDLDVTQMAPTVNPEKGQGISSAHPDGANVLFADGSAHFLQSSIPAKYIKALLTIAGSDAVDRDSF